jgi:DNA repair exonuclease SbcCD ATPase subunit
VKESDAPKPDDADLLKGSHRLMMEISAEGRRVRTAFFVGTCLFLIVGALLILVAVFYLKLAVKQMEGRLDIAVTATGDRFENRINNLFDEMDGRDSGLAAEIRELEQRTAELANKNLEIEDLKAQVKEARKKELDSRFELKRALEAIDKERRELEARSRLLDDTLALVEKQRAGEGDEEAADGDGNAAPVDSGHREREAPPSLSIALEGINRLLSEYSEEGIVIG